MTKIKLCGITNLEDAQAAIAAGADALGFNFYEKSPRCISAETAQLITRFLPPNIWRVGVFVDSSAEEVERIARRAALSVLQFHGSESPDFCARWKSWTVIKAIRLSSGALDDAIAPFAGAVDHFLFDHFDANQFGGTGKSLETSSLEALRHHPIRSISFLAGGLTPANVGALVRGTAPFGVDVASGIEVSPGKKDAAKMDAFCQAVRDAQR